MHHKRNRKPAMSTPFYDLASLVVVPSGYKSGKIYAQKPLTTDGQLTFTRASTATRVNASGLIETVSSGVPRLDYTNSSCPKILLEPQRSNIRTNSEDGSGGNWGNPYQVTVTTNQTTAPSGATTADQVLDTAFNTPHRFEPSFNATSGQAYTLSYFAKANTLTQCHIYGFTDNFVFSGQTAIFDLSAGTVVSNSGNGIAKIENYGNGWYRVSLTLTAGATALGYFGFGTAKNGVLSYLGNGSSLYMWGIQLEAGAYATSYIPTTSAAVTRVEDAAYKTGISSLIGQTEGTIFFEVDKTTRLDNDYRVQISDGTTNNWLFVSVEVGNSIRLYCNVGGVNQFSVYGSVVTSGRHKVAMAYKANDFKVYVDGVAWITQTSGNVPACSKFNLGSPAPTVDAANTDSKTAQALVFKTRLTNAQLAEITTL